MKRIALYLSLVLVVLVLAFVRKDRKLVYLTSSGRPYEVLVVVNKGERPAGRALFDVLIRMFLDYPERFLHFKYRPEHFDCVMRIFRNIIVVDIQDIYTIA